MCLNEASKAFKNKQQRAELPFSAQKHTTTTMFLRVIRKELLEYQDVNKNLTEQEIKNNNTTQVKINDCNKYSRQ